MAQQLKGKALGDALLTFLSANLTSLGLVSCAWAQQMSPEPVYPANSRTDCPLIRLRHLTVDQPQGVPQNASLYDYTMSLYYYRRQTPGQAHQSLLIADLETIHNLFASVLWQPAGMVAVAGQSFYHVMPRQLVVHNELRHPLADDPALRVSCGELVLTIRSKSTE